MPSSRSSSIEREAARRGSILVEFVLLVPILTVLAWTIVYLDSFGRSRVGAQEAARWLAFRDTPDAPANVDLARQGCFRQRDFESFKVAKPGRYTHGVGTLPVESGPLATRFLKSFLNTRQAQVELRHLPWPYPGHPEGPVSNAQFIVDLPKAPGTWYRRFLDIHEPPPAPTRGEQE